MKKLILIGLAFITIILLASCAHVTPVHDCLPAGTHIYGFWGGVWHGMIAQFAFVGSLFSDDITIYAVNNNGGWYNFGYIGGLGIIVRLIAYVIKGIASSK